MWWLIISLESKIFGVWIKIQANFNSASCLANLWGRKESVLSQEGCRGGERLPSREKERKMLALPAAMGPGWVPFHVDRGATLLPSAPGSYNSSSICWWQVWGLMILRKVGPQTLFSEKWPNKWKGHCPIGTPINRTSRTPTKVTGWRRKIKMWLKSSLVKPRLYLEAN